LVSLDTIIVRLFPIFVVATIALAGCDPIGYGYVNQLHRPVAVVHHLHGHEERFTLAAGEQRLPALGDWPGDREAFFELSGREIAVITGPEIKRLARKDSPPILVLSPSGISLATREYYEKWQQELRDKLPRR
jgi:hypothetical protein